MNVTWRVDPQRTALLVIDMQNDFVLAGYPMEVPMARPPDTPDAGGRRRVPGGRDRESIARIVNWEPTTWHAGITPCNPSLKVQLS